MPSRPMRLPSASTVKKKNCVAVKQSTSSMCPAIMFIVSRSVSVIGRRMKVEKNSSGTSRKYSGHGTPGRNSESFQNLPPFSRMPAYMNMIHGDDREDDRQPDRAVPAS